LIRNQLRAALPIWSKPHLFTSDDEGHRDPLRTETTLDTVADGLFRSDKSDGPGITSITDNLAYLAFHGWASTFSQRWGGTAHRAAYRRLLWILSWINFKGGITTRGSGKWLVYGVRALRRLPTSGRRMPPIPYWSTSPEPIVVLDTHARYDGLWRSLPEDIRAATLAGWAQGLRTKDLARWSRGDDSGLLAHPWLVTGFSLKRIRPLRALARFLWQVRLPHSGVGHGLSTASLGDVLEVLAASEQQPDVDTWSWKQVNKSPSPDPVRERLRRAAIARSIVYGSNRTFFAWAFQQINQPRRPRTDLDQMPPEDLVTLAASRIGSRSAKSAIEEIDQLTQDSGSPFSLCQAIDRAARHKLLDYVLDCADQAGKGYVEGRQLVARERIEEFTGSYAGGLRIVQAWRFGKDLRDAQRP
jgi:hypothetical protein